VPTPPHPGRSYWACQAAGWGSFVVYVLGSYLLFAPTHNWVDVASIVMTNGMVAPAATHGLRWWMYRYRWHELPWRRQTPRLVAAVLILATATTTFVEVWLAIGGGQPIRIDVQCLSILFGFCWAFAGWLLIYFAVHARRRRDALQFELRVVAREAQLRSLQAQLNPHFLFNCLNSLRHLIMQNPERATSMVTSLADLLRYSLASDRKNTVALAEELAIVDEYLALERVRFDERLQIERAVDPSALNARIPPMLVQTLVENAVKHGISDLPKGGVVRIDARRNGHAVEIQVSNTGVLKSSAAEGGYGLRNATERLRLLYGDAASLTLTGDGGTTLARLVLPLDVSDERAAG
jgi:hypothetical protein